MTKKELYQELSEMERNADSTIEGLLKDIRLLVLNENNEKHEKCIEFWSHRFTNPESRYYDIPKF